MRKSGWNIQDITGFQHPFVGRRKFLYDLWGDTVTIAKKLAAGSVDSQIRVTSNVRERLGDQVSFEGPFRIEVSGKPPIDAWRVNA